MTHHDNPSAATLTTVDAKDAEIVLSGPAPLVTRTTSRANWTGGFNFVLGGMVLAFAFLAASFAVRNSDFWLHLATGRLIADGAYQFGRDPFAYTSGDFVWVNHAWLFDFCLYRLYETMGGGGVVILKALVIALLAFVLLSVRRPRDSEFAAQGIEWPVAFTALALLVMSPRLLLQPACLSIVLLGVSFWLLWRARRGAGPGHIVALLVLFVFWVNVDSWFVLGPGLVALFWIGDRLQTLLGKVDDSHAGTPFWLVPVSLAVCLLNPYNVRAFALPFEMSSILSSTGLLQDVRFQRTFLSPWLFGVKWQPLAAVNLAEWAYFLLVALGILSFVFNRRQLEGWRVVVWLCFAGLGAWQLRLIPFFAVIAAPITSLNLQDNWAARPLPPSARALSLALGRSFLLAFCAGLIVLTIPGWLSGFLLEGRRVAWNVQPDESLVRMAATLKGWRHQGLLTEADRGFQLHPDVAHYCAWFCPEEKAYFDGRFQIYPRLALEYEEICRDLNPAIEFGAEARPARPPGDSIKIMRARGITYVVLFDPDLRRVFPAFDRLSHNNTDWELLQIVGKAAVFGLKTDARGQPRGLPAPLSMDAERLCFGVQKDAADNPAPPAPAEGPDRLPRERNAWNCFTTPHVPQPWESDAAALYLRYLEASAARVRHNQEVIGWGRFAAGLTGAAAIEPESLPSLATVIFRMRHASLFLPGVAELSPALPLLAIRDARSALAQNPDDANAYLVLAQAYLGLRHLTRESVYDDSLPPLAMLRHVQIVTALERALLLKPDLLAAHETLAMMYEERQYLDVALEHRRAQLRLARAAGPMPHEGPARFTERIQDLDRTREDREKLVQDLQNQFTIRSQLIGGSAMTKARLALQLGLPRLALEDVLLKTQVLLLGGEAVQLQAELLLMMGRSDIVDELLNADEIKNNKDRLAVFQLAAVDRKGRRFAFRLPAFEWLLFCAQAADGHYAQAKATIRQGQTMFAERIRQSLLVDARGLCFALTSEIGLMADSPPIGMHVIIREERKRTMQTLAEAFFLQSELADLMILESLVDLEHGAPDSAARWLKDALALNRSTDQPLYECSGLELAKKYLRHLRAARSE